MHTWTAEENAALRQMWLAGSTPDGCATTLNEMFGIKRTCLAIYGKIRKLGLADNGKTDRKSMRRLERAGRVKSQRRTAACSGASPIIDLRSDQCKYPVGAFESPDFHYCGAPAHKRSYCEEHFRLCYQARREKNNDEEMAA